MAINPGEIAGKEFLEVDRGYDQGEVRAFLKGVAAEHEALLERLADVDGRGDGADPGAEVSRILDAARAAAEQLLARAERTAADRVAAADKEATILRDSVGTETDRLKREAAEYAERTRDAADKDASERLGDTTRRLEQLLAGEARIRELLYSLEVILPEIREDLLNAERDIAESIDRKIVLDEPVDASVRSDDAATTLA